MKLRTHILAGLLAAAAVPSFANAAPYVGIGERQQRAELGQPQEPVSRESQPATADRKESDHRTQYVGIGELQQRGQMGIGDRGSHGGRSPEFFAEHQRAMNVGVSHIDASQQAARAVAKANRNN